MIESSGFGGVYGSGLVRPQRGSSIVIGYESALRFWGNVRRSSDEETKALLGELYPDEVLAGLDCEDIWADCSLLPLELPRSAAERIAHAATALGLEAPLDIVVGKDGARRCSAAAKCHVWKGPIPDGLVCCPEPGVYVVAPEIALLQVASKLGLYKTLAKAMELCGTYSVDRSENCVFDAARVMTSARLLKYATLAAGANGAKLARRVARVAMDNSASPMETALALMLSLARSLGGYGCEKPELNAHIDLSVPARAQCGRGYLVADLYYKDAGLDIEYQGKEWHVPDECRARDEERQNALMQMGISCVFVSRAQIADESKMDGITSIIRSRCGAREPNAPESARMRAARAELMRSLGF